MSQWKQQSGVRKNRNVKATSVLFVKSNFWQRGDNLELYHDNDGSTTQLGIGTRAPMSRLSFGDTAEYRRLEYSNNGNFALCEKSDGSEATGIGFYERHRNNNLNDIRLFTGIKFVVNKDNNNTMDTLGSNIKMLLRDDGKLLLGHDPDYPTALEPYNVALLDVSGNIRTSNFLVMKKLTSVTSYKPPGSLRYNGYRLIYSDDDGTDHLLQVESDQAKTGTWLSGQVSANRYNVYLQNVNVGVLRNLYDPDVFEAEFNVEGRITVGDQQYMKIPVKSGTTIVDVSGDGILSAQHNLTVGSHNPKALLDLNYFDKPFIKAGTDDVEVSGNSIGAGTTLNVKTSLSFCMGRDNTVLGTKDEQRGFCFGFDNKLVNGEDSYIFGASNIIYNSYDSICNFVTGKNNRVFDCSSGFISGTNNILGHISADGDFSPVQSTIFGDTNFVLCGNSYVFGNNNTFVTGYLNTGFGQNLDLSRCEVTTMFGSGSFVSDASSVTIFGDNHLITNYTTGSFIIGHNNNETLGNYNLTYGKSHVTTTSNQSFIGGENNGTSATTNTIISGKTNVNNTVNESLISGLSNNVSSTSYSTVLGQSNNSTSNTSSIVSGKSNIESNGNNNSTFGESNVCSSNTNTFSQGKSNTTTSSIESSIMGLSNEMSTSHQSMILGKSNKMIDAKGSVLLGEANDTSGNSTNILTSGFKNQITGGNNNIAFGNTSVLKTTDNSLSSGLQNTIIDGSNNTTIGNLNNLDNAHNTLLSGKSNVVKETHQSTIIGESNDVSGNTTNSLISGKTNYENNGNSNTTLGQSNINKHSTNVLMSGLSNKNNSTTHSLTVGLSNDLYDCSGSIIAGENNILKNNKTIAVFGSINDVSGNTVDSIVVGNINKEKSGTRNATFGYNNTITSATNNITSGSSNDLTSTTNNITSGSSNILINGSNNAIFGSSNNETSTNNSLLTGLSNTSNNSNYILTQGFGNVISSTNYSIISGTNHSEINGDTNSLFGKSQTVSDSSAVLLSGLNNTINASKYVNVHGESNIVKTSLNSSVFGNTHKVESTNNVLTSGHLHDVSGNTKQSLVSGYNHKENNGQNNSTFGSTQIVKNTINTLTSGLSNQTLSSNQSGIIGKSNIVTNITDTFVSGNNNIITNTFNSIIGGLNHNDTSGNANTILGNNQTSNNSINNVVNGKDNTLLNENNSVLSGDTNTLKNGENNATMGKNNVIDDASQIISTGENNKITTEQSSIISGKDNTISSGIYNAISGLFNTVTNASQSIVSGKSNNVENTSNSILAGDSNIYMEDYEIINVGTGNNIHTVSDTAVFGKSHDISNNTTNSLISGNTNKENNGTNNVTFGEENKSYRSKNDIVGGKNNMSYDSSKNAVFGEANQLNNMGSSIISGKNITTKDSNRNAIIGMVHDVSENTINSIVGGNNNKVGKGENNMSIGNSNVLYNTKNTIGGGQGNSVSNSLNTTLNGKTNVLNNVEEGLIIGDTNILNNDKRPVVFGINNNVSGNSTNVLILGRENVETSGTRTTMLGYKNTNTSAISSMTVGSENTLLNGENAILLGESNNQTSSRNILATGENNTSLRNNEIMMQGKNNNVTDSNYSLVSGIDNYELNGSENASFGKNNTSSDSTYSMTFGTQNINNNATGSASMGSSNKVTNSQNSLIYGSNSHIKDSNTSIAFGHKQDISDNTMNSFVTGYGHKDYDGRQNVLFGMEQTVNDCSNTNVGGTSNTINTTRDSTIFGKTNVINNVIRTSILGESNTVQDSTKDTTVSGRLNDISGADTNIVFGTSNSITNGLNTMVLGKSNKSLNGSQNAIIGESNNVVNPTNSMALGNSNIIGNSIAVLVSGNNNVVSNNTNNSLVSGQQNDENIGINNAVFGKSNIGKNNSASLTSGTSNDISGCVNNLSVGLSNTLRDTNQAITFGSSNNVNTNTLNTITSGNSNTTKTVSNSIIVGSTNSTDTITDSSVMGLTNTVKTSNISLVFGKENKVENVERSVVVGITNDVCGNTINSFVSGLSNKLNDTYNSGAIGSENTIKNTSNSSIALGKLNVVDSVNHGIAMGYKASVTGDTRLALGSEEVNGNIFTINKHGDLFIGRHIYSDDVEEDRNIFTDLVGGNVYIGSTTNTVIVNRDMRVENDTVIQGNLTVRGATTHIHSTNMDISDNVILLNKGIGNTQNANFTSGFVILRDNSQNQFMGWDETNDSFILGDTYYNGEGEYVTVNTKGRLLIDNLQTDMDVKIGANITSIVDEDKYLWNDISANLINIGGGSSKVRLTSTNSMVMPKGTTAQRIYNEVGGVRYNIERKNLEVCINDVAPDFGWRELGAVMDIDKDTYISAEDSHQSNNNELKFYTFGDERMIIKSDGKIGINRSNPRCFLDIDTKDAIKVPRGPISYRPTISTFNDLGFIRYNSDKNQFEGSTMVNNLMEWSALTPGGPDVDASGNIITGAQVEGSTVALYTDYTKRAEINVNGQLLLAPKGINRKDMSSNDLDLPAARCTFDCSNNDAIRIPHGKQTERPLTDLEHSVTDVQYPKKYYQGFIRLCNNIDSDTNGENKASDRAWPSNDYADFEGYDGSGWRSLSKLIDADRDTFILPEKSYGTNENALLFYVGEASKNANLAMELSKMNLHIRDTGTTNNAKLTIHTQSGDIDTSGNLRITNKILSGVVADGTHDTDKFIFDDVSNNIISIGGTSETEYHAQYDNNGNPYHIYRQKAENPNKSIVKIGEMLMVTDKVLSSKNVDKEIYTDVNCLTDKNNLNENGLWTFPQNTITIGGGITAANWLDNQNQGKPGSIVKIGYDLRVTNKIRSTTNVDKEIYTDVSPHKITIGGGESTVMTGGHLEISGNIICADNENKEIFKNVSSETITVGSGSSKVKFDSTDSIIIPKGTKLERPPTTGSFKGAIRYNTTREVFEGCLGDQWVLLNGLSNAMKNTFITAEPTFDAAQTDDNKRLLFVTNDISRAIITAAGDMGIGTDAPTELLDVNGTTKILTLKLNTLSSATPTDATTSITLTNDVIPNTDNVVSLGSSSKRFKELFVSENSVWVGDKHKIAVSGGEMKLRKRKSSEVPDTVITAYQGVPGNAALTYTQAKNAITTQIKSQTGNTVLSNVTLNEWLSYVQGLHTNYQNYTISNVFSDTSDDYEEEFDVNSWLSKNVHPNSWIYSNKLVGISSASNPHYFSDIVPSAELHVNGNIQVDTSILAGTDENKEIYTDVPTQKITIGGGDSTVTTGGHLEVSGNIISTQDEENKEIFVDTNKTIKIGSNTSKVEIAHITGSTNNNKTIVLTDMDFSANILGGGDKEKELFFDVTNEKIKIGSTNSRVQFNSVDSTILPIGTEAQRRTEQGAVRYSTDKNRFEGSDGTNWYSLMAPVDIDADTYIDAEGDGDEDKLTFITEGTGKMYLDICGNLGLGKDSKLDHNSRLQVKHDQHEWTYTRLNNDTCFTLDISENGNRSRFNMAAHQDATEGDRYVYMGYETDVSSVVIRKGGNVGIGITAPLSKFHVNGDIRVDKNIIAGTDEDKELFIDTNQTIKIGSNTSKIEIANITGGDDNGVVNVVSELHLNKIRQYGTEKLVVIDDIDISANILAGGDKDRTMMSDITSKTLTIGSGTSKVIFNSNNSVIMPKGDDSEREAVQGAIRFNTERKQFEGYSGDGWQSLKAPRDVDDNTFIDVSGGISGQNEDYLTFVTNGTEKMRIVKSGNVGINVSDPQQKLHVDGNVYLGGNNTSRTNHVVHSAGVLGVQSVSSMKIVADVGNAGNGDGSSISFPVTVSNGKFAISGVESSILTLLKGNVYQFDQSDSSNTGNTLKLSETPDGTHGGGVEYDGSNDDSTITSFGTSGTNASLTFTVGSNVPKRLYYYSEENAGMGGVINPPSDIIFGNGSSTNTSTNRDFTEQELGTYPATETMRIVSDTGNVGIGTSIPAAKLDVAGGAIIRGDLTVSGTRTIVNTTNLDISDNIIILNDGLGSSVNPNMSSGLLIKRDTSNNQFVGWDEEEGSFILGNTTHDGSGSAVVTLADRSDLKAKSVHLTNDITSSTANITDATITNITGQTIKVTGRPYSTTDYVVTVVNTPGGNVYYIDGVETPILNMIRGNTYRFNQSDATNGGHPMKFSVNNDGVHTFNGTDYSEGYATVGSPGQATPAEGDVTILVVPENAPDQLYYYCENHAMMGLSINITSHPMAAEFTDISASVAKIGVLELTSNEASNFKTITSSSITTEIIKVTNGLTMNNPSTSDPSFNLMDLLGPPKQIEITDICYNAVHIEMDIDPLKRYHVGFTPEKLPAVTKLNVKLSSAIGDIVDVSLNPTDISGNYEDITKIRFSKQAAGKNGRVAGLSNGVLSFYGLNTMMSSNPNTIKLSYGNYHPSVFETVSSGINIEVPFMPALIPSSDVTIGVLNGSTSTTNYSISDEAKVNLSWNAPDAGSGEVDKYWVRFTEVAALNNAFDPNNYIVVDGISVENILLDTSNNGLNYGTKYKFQVRAGNDAGTLADNDWSATEFTTMADYTSIPPAPPISRLDTLNIATKLWDGDWDEVYQYENISADSFSGGSDGIYYSYNDSTNTWIKHSEDPDDVADDIGRKLLRSKSQYSDENVTGVSTKIEMKDISGINCATTLLDIPSSSNKYEFKAQITDESGGGTADEQTISISNLSTNRLQPTIDTITTGAILMNVNVQDQYTSADEQTKNMNGFWLKADITNIRLDIPENNKKGEIRIKAEVPGISNASQQINTIKFATDTISTAPVIANHDNAVATTQWVGIDETWVGTNGVDWNCGIANLKIGTQIKLSVKVTNLASTLQGYYKGDLIQLNIYSDITTDENIYANSADFGVTKSENSGTELSYWQYVFTPLTITNNKSLGDLMDVWFTAYNIHGETEDSYQVKWIRDVPSLSNILRDKRYKCQSWSVLLNSDFMPAATIFEAGNIFDDTIALESNELLLFDGAYTANSTLYKDYRGLYNKTVDGAAQSGTNDSKTNASFPDDTYKWALFKLTNTIQTAGVARFGVKFHTPTSSSVSVGTAITSESIVKVINSAYTFNDASVYNASEKWSLSNGSYTFKDVPQGHPIAILNAGKTSDISYTGDDSKKFSKAVTGTTADGTYDFYYGDVTVTVNGNFDTVSVYCYYHGYMGGQNLLVHADSGSNDLNGFTDNGRTESVDFQCNILLPSVLNDGTPYWYDVNGDYESENTRATGDDYDGVTGLGIFDSKIVEANSATFVVTPPVPNSNQVVSDIWIRVGLRKNASIKFTNIELVTV